MIIGYNKNTGIINGVIYGRIHREDELKMKIGGKDDEMIIVQWKPVRWYDIDGNMINGDEVDEKGRKIAYTEDWEPDYEQKELFIMLDEHPDKIYEYKVDLKTKQLVKK